MSTIGNILTWTLFRNGMTVYRLFTYICAAGASLYLLEIGVTSLQFIYINAFIVAMSVFSYVDGYNSDE
jgi:hypothetical protein